MSRNDVHAPSSTDFDPEVYDCWGVFDNHPEEGIYNKIFRRECVQRLVAGGYRLGHGSSGQCGHCGAYIRYAALMVRDDVKEYIWVGETCLDGRFEMTRSEFQAARKAAQLDREAQRLLNGFNALVAEHPALAWATYSLNIREALQIEAEERWGFEKPVSYDTDPADMGWYDDIEVQQDWRKTSWAAIKFAGLEFTFSTAYDIARKARKYGSVSEKQIALVERLVTEAEAKWAAFSEKQDARATEQAAPVAPLVAGRQVIEGTIISRKEVEGYMGGSAWKLLIQLDGGQRVYGSEPSSLYVEKGDRVRLTAKVDPKVGEESFGFYSRPTKSEKIG